MSIQGKCEDGATFPTNVGEGRMGDKNLSNKGEVASARGLARRLPE